jgi:tetratricopeptide (TPR) repeat protein/transcriptional regulator with XRE-family HTH domain
MGSLSGLASAWKTSRKSEGCGSRPVTRSARDQFADRLRAVLEQAGLSQAALARKLRAAGFERVGEPRVSEWCNGHSLPRDEAVVLAIERLVASAGVAMPDGALVAVYWVARGQPPSDPAGPLVPRQLPPRLPEFTGRQDELARLGALSATLAGGRAVLISAIDGLGGVGKSALAVEAAWSLADRFPDGQLYLDLQGSTPGVAPLAPTQALGRILRSLGVEPRDLPTDLQEGAARLRSLTAGRRLLVLLDNARDAEQVRPLLPGGRTCAVLITSRDTLAFLDGVTRLALDVLGEAEALQLLSRLVGPGRVRAEPQAARRLVRACGLLPLAIQLVGRRLASRPRWSVAGLVDQLQDANGRLDRLRFGDRELRGSLSLSYDALAAEEPEAAQAFRLLALLDGQDVALPVAAAMLQRPAQDTTVILERLVDASLLTDPRPGRYAFHDLLRLVAREQAAAIDAPAERTAAVVRALRSYVITACDACELLHRGSWRLANLRKDIAPGDPPFADRAGALAWLEAERTNLTAAIDQAAGDPGLPVVLAWQLASALFTFFDLRGYWLDWTSANQTVLQAARRDGDRAVEAAALADLGCARIRQAEFEQAAACLQQALELAQETEAVLVQAASLNGLGIVYQRIGRYEQALAYQLAHLDVARASGGPTNQASALSNLGMVQQRLGRYEDALASYQESLAILRALDSRHGQGECLVNIAEVYERLGRYEEALEYSLGSLEVYEALADRLGHAEALRQLGVVYQRLSRFEEAVDHLRRSLAIHLELGDPHGEAETLRDLGAAEAAAGRHRQAHQFWQDALAIMERLGIPEADDVRARLAGNA